MKKIDLHELSEKIIQYRIAKNLTQLALAKKCNITQQTLCGIENETQHPSKTTLYKILNVIEE